MQYRVLTGYLYAFVQKNNSVTILGNASKIMTYKQDRLSLFLKFLKLVITFITIGQIHIIG